MFNMLLNRSQSTDRKGDASERAFTLTDLLAVIFVAGVLLFVLLPAQADSRGKSRGVRCLDNLRQMMGAVSMYTRDNHDLFPPNPDALNSVAGHNWVEGHAGIGGAAEFNSEILANPQRSLLITYLNTNVSVFRCTADLREGLYQGTDTNLFGKTVPAARSIAMNQAVGTICPGFSAGGSSHSGVPTLPVHGPWLDGTHLHRRNSPFRTYGKLADVIVPGPAQLWVMLEEDPQSINDGAFALDIVNPRWIAFPSTRHGLNGVIGFADGHVELHQWVDQRTRVPMPIQPVGLPGSADWLWLRERTSARAQ